MNYILSYLYHISYSFSSPSTLSHISMQNIELVLKRPQIKTAKCRGYPKLMCRTPMKFEVPLNTY